ncbi:uncharacterized protein LOC143464598 isoform X1 [Clavelina lepadiformis]|uniref:uncharacterized protein LOC143464598 isoform X1 n=1 Tax=Clavelina lepadiformis TaxID=159417 RepID=UPI004041B144
MDHYKISLSEKVQQAEKNLRQDIAELKNEIEETEMLYGKNTRPVSSVSEPMSAEYFAKERDMTLKKMLNVSGAQPMKNQGLVMIEELEATLKSEITEESISLLLHQFYLDRMQSLIQCKHLHMLRWQRFCEHTDTIERIYPTYRKRLDDIQSEYEDAKIRARRLSAAHHSFVLGNKKAIDCVRIEDLAIFFRWMVVHMHMTKRFTAYLKVLQWLPMIHRNNIDLQLASPVKPTADTDFANQTANDTKSAWKNITAGLDFSFLPVSPAPTRTHSAGRSTAMAVTSEMAFSGFVSNEVTLGIPTHALELPTFRDQLESLTTEYGIPIRTELLSSADEMELFGAVNRRFKTLFTRQMECSTFYQYDNIPEGYEHWGIDSASHCLLKPSNWVRYVRIKPRQDPIQLKQMTHLKQSGNIDALLESQNRFLNVSDHMHVTEALKEHAVAVRDPPTVQAVSVTSHGQGTLKANSVWQRIYESTEKQATETSNGSEHTKDMGDNEQSVSRFGNQSKRRDSYDYANTMQMLGLDEGDDSASQDPTVVQGAYLSFLHLRHLKIRDLRRQCLAVLNYFRSVERTITIYDGGLSHENQNSHTDDNEKMEMGDHKSKKKREKSASHMSHAAHNERVNHAGGGRGQSRGVGSHHYLHNTPADFKIDQNEFMEFGGIENHDDFYSLDLDENDRDAESGLQGISDGSGEWHSSIIAAAVSSGSLGAGSTPHVQDQRGYFILYDAAVTDFQELDKDLILIASQFIEKDTANRAVPRRSPAERAQRRQEAPGEVDIPSYGHRVVDRFAVLIDLWTCELNFLANKRKLLDCYLEAYHNTFDPTERLTLTQIITDVIHQRPRYDFTQDYFIRTYKDECACLRLKTTLLTQILASHIDECRHYLSRTARPLHMLGMPLHTITKQDIAINLPRPALKHVDMLEFHPTLGALASRFLNTIHVAVHDLQLAHRPSSTSEFVALERQVLEHARREWDGMGHIGASYSLQTQKEIFSGVFIEDALLMTDAVQSLIKPDEKSSSKTSIASVDQSASVETWMRALDMVLLRQRLIEAAFETEILARLYKKASSEMGFEEYHMYLRLVQFEFANRKEKVDLPPSMQTSFVPDDMSADRYIPPQLLLAIQEMDENHLPKFSFRNREQVLQLIQKGGILENLRVALSCQVVHKNALVVAITQFNNCAQWKDIKQSEIKSAHNASDSHSNHSVSTTLTQATNRSGTASPTPGRRLHFGKSYAGKLKFGFDKQKSKVDETFAWSPGKHVHFQEDSIKKHLSPEAFISIQIEKVGPRDVVVNAFIHKKETQGMMLRKEEELLKLKRSLVADFSKEVAFRMSLHAMRAQIIACYSSILTALEPFPTTRDNYFMVGRPNEKKRNVDDVEGMAPDPQTLRKRPRRVLSPDGLCFMNLWFIPHFTEILSSYRNMDYEKQDTILTTWLSIASSLHDIVLYLCAHARLGSGKLHQDNSQTSYSVAADWGGAEGVGAQLTEIQEQIDVLPTGPSRHTRLPSKVAELLSLRKDSLFLEFDAAVRYSMRETFLAMGNQRAYKCITDNMHFALPSLSNIWEKNVTCMHLKLPEPLDPSSLEAMKLFPWLSFQASSGLHSTSYPEYWCDVESCMQLCLAGLTDTERQLANGEILGVDLLLQEVLKNGSIALHSLEGPADEMPKGFLLLYQVGKNAGSRPGSALKDEKKKPIKNSKDPEEEEDEEKEEGNLVTKNVKKKEKLDPNLPLDKVAHPLESYRLMNIFLRVWKQLEMFKLEWGKMKLHVKNVDTPALYRESNHLFRSEVMLHVYTSIARQMGNLDIYDDISSDDHPIPPPPSTPELTLRARLLIKLLEVFECKMINETRQRIGRELTLVLAERSREETALPADLWRHPTTAGSGATMRENFTVSRPHLVEDFLQKLMSDCDTNNGNIIMSASHLNSCMSKLATAVMQRERENYESYTLYYENLLHHHHHLLYMKELEMKAIRSKQGLKQGGDSSVESQFQLADRSHELILEITALRSKITEMREQSMSMDQDIRDDVRKDYQELIQNLFEVCYEMKSRLALCHLSIHDDVKTLIAETREEAMRSLGKLKNETPTSTAEERLRTIHVKENQVKSLHHEQYELNMLLNKLNALNHWKRSTTGGRYKVTVEKLTQEVVKTRRDCLGKELVAKQKAELLKAELIAARQSLKISDEKLKKTHEQIEREKKMQKEREYQEVQEQRNRQQLTLARQRDMDRLMIELQEKEKRLKTLSNEAERNQLIEQTNQTKMQRNLKQMHAQLSMERNLKLDAFDRVDNLQAQAMDTERDITFISPSRPTSASLSISKSAITQRSRTQSSFLATPPPTTPKIRVRPMSSVAAYYAKQGDTPLPKKRPQTAAGRLKSKIAASILTETYPPTDEHETVIQLDRFTN